MNYQDHMKTATQAAAAEAFRYAKATPADKLGWSPLDAGRSVADQCWEMAMCPTWAYDIIEGRADDNSSGTALDKSAFATPEEWEAECNARLEKLFDLFGTISDERLAETKWLPYDGGRDFTVAEMMDYPRWNFNYHLGQISYIQTLLGDKEMH